MHSWSVWGTLHTESPKGYHSVTWINITSTAPNKWEPMRFSPLPRGFRHLLRPLRTDIGARELAHTGDGITAMRCQRPIGATGARSRPEDRERAKRTNRANHSKPSSR
ncbi:hypothetical protein GCM10025787_07280 [Saccharopolyspora rosea]